MKYGEELRERRLFRVFYGGNRPSPTSVFVNVLLFRNLFLKHSKRFPIPILTFYNERNHNRHRFFFKNVTLVYVSRNDLVMFVKMTTKLNIIRPLTSVLSTSPTYLYSSKLKQVGVSYQRVNHCLLCPTFRKQK